jgi:hypothetical protein
MLGLWFEGSVSIVTNVAQKDAMGTNDVVRRAALQ